MEKHEFKALLVNLFYFNRLWKAFDDVDTGILIWRGCDFFFLLLTVHGSCSDDDRRIDLNEFKHGLKFVGMNLSTADAEKEFQKIDKVAFGV